MLTVNRVQKLFDSLNSNPWTIPWEWPRHWDAMLTPAFNLPAESQNPRIWSGDDSVILEVDLPGRQLEEIDVSVEQNLVFVSTETAFYADQNEPNFRIRERSDGKATMQFRLPFHLQPEQVEVVYHNGVLRIQVTRPEEEKPRKVAVRQG